MSLDHRIVLGRSMDAATTAARTLVDRRAEGRIVKALDWEHDRKAEGARIAAALKRLSAADRAFARAVLDSKGWAEIGVSRQLFEWKLKKVEKFFRRVNTGFE